MKFGPGCFDFEVDPFEPICSHPVLPGSEPAAFDVPLPSLVQPVPPTECVCFDFKSEEVAVKPVSCNTEAKCSVTIEKLDPDCCTGRYKVTPNIEVPCIPFDIARAVVTTSVSSGATGKASFRLEKNCNNCSIQPYLDIVFPTPNIDIPGLCVPEFDSTNATISFSFRTANQAPGTAAHVVSGDNPFVSASEGSCQRPDHNTNDVVLSLGGSGGVDVSCAHFDEASWRGSEPKGRVKYTFFDKSRERQEKIAGTIISDLTPTQECPSIGLSDVELDLSYLYVGAGKGLSWGGETGDILNVSLGPGLEFADETSNAAVRLNLASGTPLYINKSSGALSFDGSKLDFAAKDHKHGDITSDGKLSTAGYVVVTGSGGKITFDANLETADAVALIKKASTFGDGELLGEKTLRGLTITGTTSGVVGLTLNGPARQITFGSSGYAAISSDDTGAILIDSTSTSANLTGKTAISLSAPPNMTLLKNQTTLEVENASGSKAVATCGWVASNFDASSGYEKEQWMKTDSNGKIGTTSEKPLAVDPEQTGVVYNTAGAISYKSIGTEIGTVAAGNHLHTGVYLEVGALAGYAKTADGVAQFKDASQYAKKTDNVSQFTNDANYLKSADLDDYPRKSADFATDGDGTYAENELLVHNHYASDVLVGWSGKRVQLSGFFNTDNKLALATALEQGTDGDIHVINNKLTVRVGDTADKWVKTTTDGALTIADSDPITADKTSTGVIYNTAGTVSYKSLGDGLEEDNNNSSIKVKATTADLSFGDDGLKINDTFSGTTVSHAASVFARNSEPAREYVIPLWTFQNDPGYYTFTFTYNNREYNIPMYVKRSANKYIPNIPDELAAWMFQSAENRFTYMNTVFSYMAFSLVRILPNGIIRAA